jgi:hypothetical protein
MGLAASRIAESQDVFRPFEKRTVQQGTEMSIDLLRKPPAIKGCQRLLQWDFGVSEIPKGTVFSSGFMFTFNQVQQVFFVTEGFLPGQIGLFGIEFQDSRKSQFFEILD